MVQSTQLYDVILGKPRLLASPPFFWYVSLSFPFLTTILKLLDFIWFE